MFENYALCSIQRAEYRLTPGAFLVNFHPLQRDPIQVVVGLNIDLYIRLEDELRLSPVRVVHRNLYQVLFKRFFKSLADVEW